MNDLELCNFCPGYCDTTATDGGFKFIGPFDELMVAIPSDFAALIKVIPLNHVQSTLEAVMGKPACYGLYNCVFMDITHEETATFFVTRTCLATAQSKVT